MSLKLQLMCILTIITMIPADHHVQNTTTTTTSVNNKWEANPLPDYLRQDLPHILMYIFMDTYIIMSNTIVIVPGCKLPPTKNTQSDILAELLVQANKVFALEIQTDFTHYDAAAVTFLWFIDSIETFR